MKVQLWLITETERARRFSRTKEGIDSFWVPRSVCRSTLKHPISEHSPYQRCEVEIEEWFCEKVKIR